MKHKILILITAIGTSLLLAGAGCTSPISVNSKSNNTPSAGAVAQSSGVVKNFTVTAKQFTFGPRIITVNKGDTVRLTLVSQDVEHSFSLPVFNVNVDLPPGQTKTIEFIASQAGTFTFSCWIYCGDGHSDMVGKLVVQ